MAAAPAIVSARSALPSPDWGAVDTSTAACRWPMASTAPQSIACVRAGAVAQLLALALTKEQQEEWTHSLVDTYYTQLTTAAGVDAALYTKSWFLRCVRRRHRHHSGPVVTARGVPTHS